MVYLNETTLVEMLIVCWKKSLQYFDNTVVCFDHHDCQNQVSQSKQQGWLHVLVIDIRISKTMKHDTEFKIIIKIASIDH